jgi:hypothetical protein
MSGTVGIPGLQPGEDVNSRTFPAGLGGPVEGVTWAGLVDALLAAHGLGRPAADTTLTEIIQAARTLPAEPSPGA